MGKEEIFVVEGDVTEVLPNTLFRVVVTQSDSGSDLIGKEILCHLSGKMRRYHIKVIQGDKIKAEMTPYDLNKGRINYRYK